MNDDQMEMDSAEEASESIAEEAHVARQAMEANLAMYITLESLLKNPHQRNTPILAQVGLQTAFESIGMHEVKDYSKLTLEELAREKTRFWERFKHHFADFYKRTVDHYQSFWTLFQFQTNRIKKLRAELSQLRGTPKAKVRTSMSKYMKYGRDEYVGDSKTYIGEFTRVQEVMKRVCVATSDLNDASKFNIPSYLGNKAIWNGDQFVMDHFKTLNEIVRGVISKEHMRLERKTERAEVFATSNLLGMSQIVCKVPLKANVRYNDYDSAIENVNLIYMFVDRIEKFSTETFNSNGDYMEFDKRQIDELIKMCDTLANEAVALIEIAKKYNQFIDDFIVKLSTISPVLAPALSIIYKDTRMDAQDVDVTPSIRIISRYMSMCYDCTGSSYNFSMGNVKKALSMIESYIAQVKH